MYNQGLGTIIHRHSRCSCSCFPLNLTSSVNLCWCISSSLSHSFASISIRRKEVPHSCSRLWSRLWCFAFYGSSNVTLEPLFCTPGEAPVVSPPSQESHSLPTGTVRKTPTTVQNLLWLSASSPGPGVQYPTENLSENSLYVHETSCYLNIQDKSHGIPKCPVITLQTYLKAQPLFHCKFPLFWWIPVNSSSQFLISLHSSHLSYGHIYPLFSNLKSNSASMSLSYKNAHRIFCIMLNIQGCSHAMLLALANN